MFEKVTPLYIFVTPTNNSRF